MNPDQILKYVVRHEQNKKIYLSTINLTTIELRTKSPQIIITS
jgi:hypothetical protein